MSVNAGIQLPTPFSIANTAAPRRTLKPPAVRCLRINDDDDDGDRTKASQASSNGERQEVKYEDIWRLFREAQKNILYLNNQRLVAIEELSKIRTQKQSLLEKVEKLEAAKQASTPEDKLSLDWELLLRIDSMILKGMIGTEEASNLRRLVMNSKASIAHNIFNTVRKEDVELLAELRCLSEKTQKNCFHIFHICTEMAPVVAVGALASYITGLSHKLQSNGNFVEVILPKYASLDLDEVQGLQEIEAEFYSYYNGQLYGNRVWTGVVYGIGVTFLQPLYYSSFFSRERVYGYSDDFERFSYFSRASLDYIVKSGKQPDVLHVHNWQTAIVGPLFWDIFAKQGLGNTRILLTCHGFDDQCLEEPHKLELCGLDPSRLHRSDRLQDNNKMHLVNILKGGIVYSNVVVIMSSIHEKGQIIHSLGHGLEPTLDIHKDKLLIAPFGFHQFMWNPSKDKLIPKKYSCEDMKGKAVCKVASQHHLGLRIHASTILVGCILSEITHVDVEKLKAIVLPACRNDVQFVFMGLSQIPSINRAVEAFQDDNVKFVDKYDEGLLHLILAGSDIVLSTSFGEAGLQILLKAMKYGAAPVALKYHDDELRRNEDYDKGDKKSLHYVDSNFANLTLDQVLYEIKNRPVEWSQWITDAMAKDFTCDVECYDTFIGAYTSLKNM